MYLFLNVDKPLLVTIDLRHTNGNTTSLLVDDGYVFSLLVNLWVNINPCLGMKFFCFINVKNWQSTGYVRMRLGLVTRIRFDNTLNRNRKPTNKSRDLK